MREGFCANIHSKNFSLPLKLSRRLFADSLLACVTPQRWQYSSKAAQIVNYTELFILRNSCQNLTQFFQPFIWMEDAAEGNSVLAARYQGFWKVPGTKHAHSEQKDEPNIETGSTDWGINPPCSAQQSCFIVILCIETKGKIWQNVVIWHLTVAITLHTRWNLSLWLLFLLTIAFSPPPLFLNFFSSTLHSLVLLSLCNLMSFIIIAKTHSIHQNDQCLNNIVDTDVSI